MEVLRDPVASKFRFPGGPGFPPLVPPPARGGVLGRPAPRRALDAAVRPGNDDGVKAAPPHVRSSMRSLLKKAAPWSEVSRKGIRAGSRCVTGPGGCPRGANPREKS